MKGYRIIHLPSSLRFSGDIPLNGRANFRNTLSTMIRMPLAALTGHESTRSADQAGTLFDPSDTVQYVQENHMSNYKVKYKVGNVQSMRTLQLQGGTESEAIAKLKQQSSVPKDADVIILSIEPV